MERQRGPIPTLTVGRQISGLTETFAYYAVSVKDLFAVSTAVYAGVTEWETYTRRGIAEFERGDYQSAASSLKAALREAEGLGDQDERVALTLNILGSHHLSRGDYASAEPPLERALAIREKVFGAEHPGVARSLNNLAMLHATQARYDKAEALLKRATAIWEKTRGRYDPEVATSLNNLAMLYSGQARYDQAELLFKRTIDIWQRAGDRHNLATALMNLSKLYAKIGRPVDSGSALQRAVALNAYRDETSQQSHDGSRTLQIILPR